MKRPSSSPARRSAFTLIELLTVMAIMAVLAGIVVTGLGGFGGATTPAAQRSVSGLVDAARTTAQLRQSDAYLLIYADDLDPTKFLRYLGVVYVDDNDTPSNPADDVLTPVGSGTYLPQGVFVVPDGTGVSLAADVPGSPNLYESDLGGPFPVAYPNPDGPKEAWYLIGFGSTGQTIQNNPLVSSGTLPRSPLIVLSPGVLASDALTVEITDPFASAAIFVRPSGNPVLLRDFQEIADTAPADTAP